MKIRDRLLFLTTMILCLISCNSNTKKSRLFIVQEIRLDDGRSLFWFRVEQELTNEELSYFQITNDKCELSVKNAIASCTSPVQIYDSSGDAIFILTQTPLLFMRTDNRFYLKAENKDYPNIYPEHEWSIQGKVIGVIRRME